ncbi:TPA: hypothetical protein ACH3X2_002060 [Trebouxia sp. C0005]
MSNTAVSTWGPDQLIRQRTSFLRTSQAAAEMGEHCTAVARPHKLPPRPALPRWKKPCQITAAELALAGRVWTEVLPQSSAFKREHLVHRTQTFGAMAGRRLCRTKHC